MAIGENEDDLLVDLGAPYYQKTGTAEFFHWESFPNSYICPSCAAKEFRVLGGAAYSQGPLPKEAGKYRLMSRVRGKVPLHFSCKIEVVKDAVTGQLKPGSVVPGIELDHTRPLQLSNIWSLRPDIIPSQPPKKPHVTMFSSERDLDGDLPILAPSIGGVYH